jgi:hypothetical protein
MLAERHIRPRFLLGLGALALLLLGLLHACCLHYYPKALLDPQNLSDFYPLSVFQFRVPEVWQLGFGLCLVLSLAWVWPRLERIESTGRIVLIAWGACFLTKLLDGWRFGIDYPTATWGDNGVEYYHDAIWIKNPLVFLAHFNSSQIFLFEHSRTHPPGAVLLYYFLFQVFQNPGLISLAVAGIALGLALPAWRRLLELSFGSAPQGSVLLLALLPAFLIYGLACLDAVVAASFLMAWVNFLDESSPRNFWLATLFVFLSALLSFAVLYLVALILVWAFLEARLLRALKILGIVMAALLSIKFAIGFDWLQSFSLASFLENPQGFRLFSDPAHYFWFRLAIPVEIAFFYTPFMLWMTWRGLQRMPSVAPRFSKLPTLASRTFIVFLASGALKNGEGARVAIFLLPFLLLPAVLAWRELDASSRRLLATGLFAWATLMQLFGFYQW